MLECIRHIQNLFIIDSNKKNFGHKNICLFAQGNVQLYGQGRLWLFWVPLWVSLSLATHGSARSYVIHLKAEASTARSADIEQELFGVTLIFYKKDLPPRSKKKNWPKILFRLPEANTFPTSRSQTLFGRRGGGVKRFPAKWAVSWSVFWFHLPAKSNTALLEVGGVLM